MVIEAVAGKAHHLASSGYITKLGCQIKQTYLVLDNILASTK
jgi:hypothetical protein